MCMGVYGCDSSLWFGGSSLIAQIHSWNDFGNLIFMPWNARTPSILTLTPSTHLKHHPPPLPPPPSEFMCLLSLFPVPFFFFFFVKYGGFIKGHQTSLSFWWLVIGSSSLSTKEERGRYLLPFHAPLCLLQVLSRELLWLIWPYSPKALSPQRCCLRIWPSFLFCRVHIFISSFSYMSLFSSSCLSFTGTKESICVLPCFFLLKNKSSYSKLLCSLCNEAP